MKAKAPADGPNEPGGVWGDRALYLRQLRDGSNET